MEAPNTAPKNGTGKKNKNAKKRNHGKAVAAEANSESMDGDSTKEVEAEEAVLIKPVNGASKDDVSAQDSPAGDNANSSEVDSLQQELQNEKERNRNLEEQLRSLSDDAELTAALKAELGKERKKSQSLEQQLQTLLNSSSSEGDKLSQLQKALEEERVGRAQDVAESEKKLREVEEAKEHLDGQYKTLLGRVSTIRSTLGERLKADAEELSQSRRMVEELEEQNKTLQDQVFDLRNALDKADEEKETVSETLRNRLNVSQQNWAKERDDLLEEARHAREDHEATRQAMQDWEVIATEERSVRETLGDRVIELEEQLSTRTAAYEKLVAEKDRDASAIDGLQRALRDIQEARRKELREVVESMQAQVDQLTTKAQALEIRAKEAEAKLSAVTADLQRVLPFEKEVKEKNLLIGKLRHEAVTLNDHLRKALRMLKRDNADDKIDKQLVTNVFLQFVCIERGDTKKYEILQLIASVLDWDDQQREKAGLLRPGTAASSFTGSSLKTPPLSPFHRSSSTPSLSDAYDGSRELWSSVLDSEKS